MKNKLKDQIKEEAKLNKRILKNLEKINLGDNI